MAAICFGPPPLPPNKKSLSNFNRSRKHITTPLLSSTYLSFRDPAEENDIVVMAAEENEMSERTKNDVKPEKQQRKKLVHTNSLIRSKTPKVNLVRSQSDGNLNKPQRDVQPMTINKYVKMLSGSWKNLLNCKFYTTVYLNKI